MSQNMRASGAFGSAHGSSSKLFASGTASTSLSCSRLKPSIELPSKVSTAAHVNAGPCSVNCWNQGEIYAFHTGVANVCMGDGSVRTVKSTIVPWPELV